MIIMPGYCVAGTVGYKVINGAKKIDDASTGRPLEINLRVEYMSFSAHADAKGIMQVYDLFFRISVFRISGSGTEP